MVHTFFFNHNGEKIYLVWDTESGSLHLVGYDAFLYVKDKYDLGLDKVEANDFLQISDDTKAEIANEVNSLEENGSLNAKIIDFVPKGGQSTIKALCLHICHDCNMVCAYCFAGGGNYNKEKCYMSLQTAKNAVDFLIKNSGKKKNIEIDFFGGEPLLNFDVVKDTVSYAKEQGKLYNKEFFFTMTTNGLNLDDETANYLNEEMGNVILSIDGRPNSHNLLRKAKNGDKDSYDKIIQNCLNFRQKRGDRDYYVRGTYTSKNLNFCDDIEYLHNLGFDKVSIEPVVLDDANPLSVRCEHLDLLKQEYEKLAKIYLDRIKGGEKLKFFHFMIDLKHGPCVNKRLNGCGAGFEYLAVSPEGGLYPCHQFVGDEKYLMGDVLNGIVNNDIGNKFKESTVYSKPHCTDCMAKYYCGGGCFANAIRFGGDFNGQYKVGCELQKKRLELSLVLDVLKNCQ